MERNISYNQFLSLAGIAQYYRGFETPFISNMPEKAAKGLIVDAIYSALKNNISYIFDIDKTTLDSSGILSLENFENKIRSLATGLFSPYSSYPIEFIKENAVINYTELHYPYTRIVPDPWASSLTPAPAETTL